MKKFKNLPNGNTEITVENVRIVKNSYKNIYIVNYDDIDRTDGTGAYRKGTPLSYEVKRYNDNFNIDISHFKKSDFPLMINVKTHSTKKVKILEEYDDFDVIKYTKMLRNFVMLYFFNDNISFLIHKDDVKTFLKLSLKNQNKVISSSE